MTGKCEGKSFFIEKAKKFPTIKILTEEEFINMVEGLHMRRNLMKKRMRNER